MKKSTNKKSGLRGITEPERIKLVDKRMALIILQDWVTRKEISNAGLISLALHHHVRKFLNGLEEIFLSEELQPTSPVSSNKPMSSKRIGKKGR